MRLLISFIDQLYGWLSQNSLEATTTLRWKKVILSKFLIIKNEILFLFQKKSNTCIYKF